MKVRAFITHKMCEQYADCQDRFCINEDNRRIGLSDGMSQSIFPDYWAEILSKQYSDEGHCDEEDRKKLCALWLKRVMAYLQEQKDKGIDPWRAENSIAARKGAGAPVEAGRRHPHHHRRQGDPHRRCRAGHLSPRPSSRPGHLS